MSYIGQIQEFNPAFDDWNIYFERLEQYFEINDLPEAKQTALLINLIGQDSYKTLRDLCHPELPKEKSFEELADLLKNHFMPKISVFRERIKFYQARQKPNENITSWYARVKKLSIDCRFKSAVEDILLDRFICGLKPSPVVDRLCEEDETLTMAKALEIALAKESSIPQVPYSRPKQFSSWNESNQQPTNNENQSNENEKTKKKFIPRKPNLNVNVNVVAAGKTGPKSSNSNTNNNNKKKEKNNEQQ